MKPIVYTQPREKLKERDSRDVDRVVGKRRLRPDEIIDWGDCGLAKRYPTWNEFHESLYLERMRQRAGGPLGHPRAWKPSQPVKVILTRDPPPWEAGPSCAKVNQAYGTTDRGR